MIVFYSGHGGFTPGDRKFFVATRSTTELLEGATSIRIVDLATVLKVKAPWARKYLIFDCCFAGAVVAEFMASPGLVAVDETREVFPSKGTAVLCSSSSEDLSIAPLGGRYNRFSEALFGVLLEGNKRVPTDLCLHDVGAQVRERIFKKYPEDRMRPEVHSPDQKEGDVASVHVFPNAALRPGRRREERDQVELERRRRKKKERLETESRQRAEKERVTAEIRKRKEKEQLDRRRLEHPEREFEQSWTDLGIARIFQTRTRAFTDEYLVSESGPVPFGGRDPEQFLRALVCPPAGAMARGEGRNRPSSGREGARGTGLRAWAARGSRSAGAYEGNPWHKRSHGGGSVAQATAPLRIRKRQEKLGLCP